MSGDVRQMPGAEQGTDEFFRRRVFAQVSGTVVPLVLLGAVLRHLSFPFSASMSRWLVVAIVLFGISAFLGARNGRRDFGWGRAFYWAGAFLLVAIGGFTNGGLRAPVIAFSVVFPMCAVATMGRTSGKAVTAASAVSLIGLYFMEVLGWAHPLQFPDPLTHSRVNLGVYVFILLLSYYFGSAFDSARRLASQRLVEMSRISDLGTMAGGLSHEINNPASAVLNGIEFLEIKLRSGALTHAEAEKTLLQIRRATLRTAKILELLKLYSADESTVPVAEFSAEQLVRDVFMLCEERFAGEGVRLGIDLPGGDFQVVCRRAEVSRVLLSLLNNSFDAVLPLKERWVQVALRGSEDWAEIVVIDSGFGIPAEMRPVLFTPFFTTKVPGKGVGMALSVGISLMHKQGGRLYYDESAHHTTFVMVLPAAEPSASATPDLMRA